MAIHVLTHYCLSILSGFLSILLGLFISTVDAAVPDPVLGFPPQGRMRTWDRDTRQLAGACTGART